MSLPLRVLSCSFSKEVALCRILGRNDLRTIVIRSSIRQQLMARDLCQIVTGGFTRSSFVTRENLTSRAAFVAWSTNVHWLSAKHCLSARETRKSKWMSSFDTPESMGIGLTEAHPLQERGRYHKKWAWGTLLERWGRGGIWEQRFLPSITFKSKALAPPSSASHTWLPSSILGHK